MEKKPRPRKGKAEEPEFDSFDLQSDQFEDFDVHEGEPAEDEEMTEESLGGLAAEDEYQSLMRARDEVEKTYLLEPAEAMASTAEEGTAGKGNIVGVGIGEKEVDGIPTGQLAVKVFVREKLNPGQVSASALIPQTVGGLSTDVDVTGEIGARMFTQRLRPAPGGVSIGNCRRVMAGTLGCLVRRATQLFILSNNHVIALTNTSPLNERIPQPGRLDGGLCPADTIARLSQFVPIRFDGQCNFVDAAIGRTSPLLVDRRILRPGGVRQPLVAPTLNPALFMMVQKSGRTTQYRRGMVDAVNVTINVNYAPLGGIARFCRQFRVRGIGADFSAPGDSGSLITAWPVNRPVGLLFAGGGGFTFGNPINAVLNSMGVQIVF